ncbi:hypothetical protein ANN_12536 [Periplaneta americana]|uniref:Uncharacterized protein n=1 Tax=Periplaneta americana TaxID=6978 RepID=A0ABQ8TI94_PERAM|nr:hypothetical protein ANN_12536 [Periplaneta americana]
MAGLCEGGNKPPGSLKACKVRHGAPETRGVRSVEVQTPPASPTSVHQGPRLTPGGLLASFDKSILQNQSDSLMAADGDCHHLCKLMAPVRHRWSINDVIGGIRNTVMPSDCSAVKFGIRSTFKVCHGSLYAVMWLADEPREFNLPTLPQRCITYEAEKLPSKYDDFSDGETESNQVVRDQESMVGDPKQLCCAWQESSLE